MKKLTERQIEQKAYLLKRLEDQREVLNDSIVAFNTLVKEKFDEIAGNAVLYNEVVEEAHALATEVSAAMDLFYENQSDAWRETDEAQVHQGWAHLWESLELDEVEIEEPSEVDEIEDEVSNFELLPDELK